jgi:imidazolonepropionase-like amidohydrolase
VPGLGLQRELVLLVEAGLTPAEALRAATIVGAEVLGLKGVGQILVGYRADLFGVRADPLAGIAALSDVALVVREGERLERTALLRTAERATRVVK